jgi:hypothetical protein
MVFIGMAFSSLVYGSMTLSGVIGVLRTRRPVAW